MFSSVVGHSAFLENEYEPVKLECTVEGLSDYTVEWYRKGQRLSSENTDRKGQKVYSIMTANNAGSLTIINTSKYCIIKKGL